MAGVEQLLMVEQVKQRLEVMVAQLLEVELVAQLLEVELVEQRQQCEVYTQQSLNHCGRPISS
jgi:hypothetical protein